MHKITVQKNLKLIFLTAFIVLFLVHFSCAATPGTSGAAFLKIGAGSRPTGMGGAFTGVANDINAIYWNPAGLNLIEDKEITYMYNSWFQGINYHYAAYTQNLNEMGLGTIGGALTLVDWGLIPRTKESGTSYEDDGNFGASNLCFTFSYAQSIIERYNLGLNFKVIVENIDKDNAMACALDLGFLYDLAQIKGLTLGVSIQNIGTSFKFDKEEFSLPVLINLGMGYNLHLEKSEFMPAESELLLAADIYTPLDFRTGLRFGVEWLCNKVFMLRLGYKTDTIAELGGLSGLTIGMGAFWKNFGLDYAFVPWGILGDTHRLSLNMKFPGIEPPEFLWPVKEEKPEKELKEVEEKKLDKEEELRRLEEELRRLESGR